MSNEQAMTKLPTRVVIRTNGKVHGKISGKTYKQMYEQQCGVCAICGKPETTKNRYGSKVLSLDHCHKTGSVRGLLCFECNSGLGKFGDDIAKLEKAIEYLQDEPANVEILPLGKKGGARKRCILVPQIRVLRMYVDISLPKLAEISGVPYRTIYRAEKGEPVVIKAMEQVLKALNSQIGTNYTLENIPDSAQDISSKMTIKQLRLKAGMTAFDLAAKSGVSLSTITRMERATNRQFSELTVNKVLNTLSEVLRRDVAIDDVFGISIIEEAQRQQEGGTE